MPNGTRLCDLAPGSWVTVVSVGDGLPPETGQRLRDLGFSVGTQVTVVRRAPLRDPVVYRLKDTEICLRRDLAAGVWVRVAEADGVRARVAQADGVRVRLGEADGVR